MNSPLPTLIQRIKAALSLGASPDYLSIVGEISESLGKAAKPWKEEDHPRGARGRWTPTGEEDGRAWTVSSGMGAGAWFDHDKGKWVIQVGKEIKPLSKEWHDRYEAISKLSTDKIHKGMVDVRLNPDFTKPLVAVGRPWIEKEGRPGNPKWIYTDEHKVKKYKAKWAAMKKFDVVKAKLKEKSYADALTGKPAAMVTFLMDQTAIRVGSGNKAVEGSGTFGACDLLAKHVEIRGNRVEVNFLGKGKKRWHKAYVSEKLATVLKIALTAKDGDGTRDKKGNERLFPVSRDTVATYMRSVAGKGSTGFAKPHMFRYWAATALAVKVLGKSPKPKTKEAALELKKEVCQHVADYLNDTPEMVYSTYIAPTAWKDWGEAIRPASPALHQKALEGMMTSPTSDSLQRYMDEYLDSLLFPDFEYEDEWTVDELYPDMDEPEPVSEPEIRRKGNEASLEPTTETRVPVLAACEPPLAIPEDVEVSLVSVLATTKELVSTSFKVAEAFPLLLSEREAYLTLQEQLSNPLQ